MFGYSPLIEMMIKNSIEHPNQVWQVPDWVMNCIYVLTLIIIPLFALYFSEKSNRKIEKEIKDKY